MKNFKIYQAICLILMAVFYIAAVWSHNEVATNIDLALFGASFAGVIACQILKYKKRTS